MAQAITRQRRFVPKMRTGCKTCKERHIKCDEQRPSCLRCLSTGRVCDGYHTIVVAQAATKQDGSLAFRWTSPSSYPPETSPQEQAALHTFRLDVLQNLTGPIHARAWDGLMLPLAMNEPAVRHAAIALGASESRSHGNQFVLRHYSKAMKALHQISHTRNTAPELILVTCLLFVALEFRQGGWNQAISHATGGLKIILESQEDPSRRSILSDRNDVDAIVEAFERLDIQTSLFTSSRVQLNRSSESELFRSDHIDMSFGTIGDAGRPLNLLVAGMRELVYSIEEKRFSLKGLLDTDYALFEIQATRLLVTLHHWHKAMTTLLPTLTSAREEQAARTLQVQYLCCKLFVSNCLSDGHEALWDNFLPEFEAILNLAEAFLAAERRSNEDKHRNPGFLLDMGVIPPTYFVVLKCRDPEMRRRGLDILRSCKHQEGAWNGPLTAVMAEAVVQLEEKGLRCLERASDVPESRRFYQASYDLAADGPGAVYCKRRVFEEDGRWISERLICS